MNALHIASIGSMNLSDVRVKIISFIINMNLKSLEHTNRKDNMNVLHNVLRRNPVSYCVRQRFHNNLLIIFEDSMFSSINCRFE